MITDILHACSSSRNIWCNQSDKTDMCIPVCVYETIIVEHFDGLLADFIIE